MEVEDIQKRIEQVVKKCSENPEIYSNIIKDFYTKGIDKPSIYLLSLNIMPNLKAKDIQNKFKENQKIIIDYIKNQIKPDQTIYKILSCIFGSFLGDALGAFCEFHVSSKDNSKKIFQELPVFGQLQGQITDDSEMAMSFAYAMMDNPNKETIDINYLYFYYGAWVCSDPIDIGNTTIEAFSYFNFKDFHPKKNNFNKVIEDIFNKNYNSLSNGFLMRKSTFIAWVYFRFYGLINDAFNKKDNKSILELYNKLKELSRIDNQCTHPNSETDVVSSFYCIMALGALKDLKANEIIDKLLKLCNDNYFQKKGKNDEEFNFANFIIHYINKYKLNKFDFWDNFTKGESNDNDCVTKYIGWYGHAIKLTLYYLINFEKKNDFTNIMKEICDLGGDTDTNCCIVGGVIGPLVGLNNFGEYFDKVLNVIPQNRYIFSICIMLLYVLYLKKSSRNEELIKDEHYFLKTILTLLYDNIEIND